MQLGKFTDYGLRVLIHLAAVSPDRVPVGAIAKAFDLSDHHLAKVCSRLVNGGFLNSTRGRTGGLTLAHPAKDIPLGDAIRCLSQDTALVECFAAGHTQCRILPLCGARQPLAEAENAFYASLNQHSLADVSRNKPGLKALLGAH